MTAPVSMLPPLIGAWLPPASPQGLSDGEQALVNGLSQKLAVQAAYAMERYWYYDGEQRSQNLGISVPQVLASVRTVVDWPRVVVDRQVERAARIDGFRLPGSTEIDDELRSFCVANEFDSELPLALQDSLVARTGFMVIGSPDTEGDAPLLTVESPLNLALTWDPRTRRVTAAYQSYEVEGVFRAVLYLPNQTVSMSRQDQGGQWTVDDRDQHMFGEVPVVRLPNRTRPSDREGRSEITRAIMSATDSACRSLLAMEIAREFYSIPHKYVLGADESSFLNPDGTKKTPLDMGFDKFLAFARDDNNNLPTVGQFNAHDPSVFTKNIDEQAQLVSSYTGFPASYFGLTTTANPASADAIRVAERGIEKAASRVQLQATAPLRKAAQLMWRFAHRAEPLPDELKQVEVDWVSTATFTPAATTDALTKQVAEGIVPATSDVVLKAAGYTAIERARLAQDRANDPAQQLINELGSQVTGKDLIAALRLLKATGQPVPTPDDTATPADVPAPPPVPPQSR